MFNYFIHENADIKTGNISENAMIGVSSVVIKGIQVNTIWYGNPAKSIRICNYNFDNDMNMVFGKMIFKAFSCVGIFNNAV